MVSSGTSHSLMLSLHVGERVSQRFQLIRRLKCVRKTGFWGSEERPLQRGDDVSGIAKSLNRTAVLETNLVLLLLVAEKDRGLLRRYKRVQMFDDRDVSLLQELPGSFRSTLTTPQILTEVSNLLGQVPPHERPKLMAALVGYISSRREIYVESNDLAQRDTFHRLGLTDASFEELSSTHTVITEDYRLAGKIHAMGGKAVNFDHLRSGYLLPNGGCLSATSIPST